MRDFEIILFDARHQIIKRRWYQAMARGGAVAFARALKIDVQGCASFQVQEV